MKALLFVLANLSAAGASLALTRAFFRDEAPAARILISVALFPVIVVVTLIPLSLAHMLSPVMVVAVCTGTWLASRALGRRPSSVVANMQSVGAYEEAQNKGPWDLQAKLALALLILRPAFSPSLQSRHLLPRYSRHMPPAQYRSSR